MHVVHMWANRWVDGDIRGAGHLPIRVGAVALQPAGPGHGLHQGSILRGTTLTLL